MKAVTQYEERTRKMQKVPRFSYGRRIVRADGGPKRLFFCNLFNDHAMAIEFLKDHSIHCVDHHAAAHINTIESTWRRVKVFLGQYNRGDDYEFHGAHCMFAVRCKARGVPHFLQFLRLVANTHWYRCHSPRWTVRATWSISLNLRN